MIHSSKYNSNHGASEVIGFVLLISIAVVMSVFVVAAAEGGPISALEDQSSNEQVKNTFSQVSSSSVGAAVGGENTSETVPTPFASTSNPINISEEGSITVKSYENESDTSGDLIFEDDLGYLEYTRTNSDKTIYYQNGAVWRIYENGGVETVTAPEFHYNRETLTLPIIQIQAEDDQATEQISFNHESTSRSSTQMTTEDTIIRVTIDGPTYQGWGDYFEKRFGATYVEYDHENSKVTATLGTAPQTYNTIDDEVAMLEGTLARGNNSTVTGDVIENASQNLPEADSAIEDQKTYSQNNGTTLSTIEGKTLTNGDYYIDDADLGENETLTVDVSGGDVSLAVDQNISMDNDSRIKVVNTTGNDNTFSTYLDGNLDMQPGSKWTVDEDNKGQNVVYASSTSEFHPKPHTVFQGVYYAPGGGDQTNNSGPPNNGGGNGGGGNAQCGPSTAVCMQPHSSIQGSVIADSAEMQPHAEMNFDNSLQGLELEDTTGAVANRPDLSYFHSSTTVVKVSDKDE